MRKVFIIWSRHLLISLAVLGATPVLAQSLEQLIQAGVIPKTASKPLELKPLLNRVPQGDLEISIFLTKWAAGARTPIHQHDFGGLKCLVQGEATLYVEDKKPQTYTFPSCVEMPPGVPMVNVASGKDDPVFYVIFIGKKGHPYWTVTEKGVSADLLHDFAHADHGNQ